MKFLIEKNNILDLLINPIFLFTASTGILGFFLFQLSMKKEKASHVAISCTSTATIIPVIGGLLLGELIKLSEVIGIILITLSAVILILKSS